MRASQGVDILISALEICGVSTVFHGPCTDELASYSGTRVRHVRACHEQGAGHAAEGYAMATGEAGVCVVAAGPGATSLVTPVINAYKDSTPLVAIVLDQYGRADERLADISLAELAMSGIKHAFTVTEVSELSVTIAEAFRLATAGRPGPVVVEIARAALTGYGDVEWPAHRAPAAAAPPPEALDAAARLIRESRRPVLYVGGGVQLAGATAGLRALAELTGAPVVTTLMALGSFPGSHPQNLGMPGMHGSVAAVGALQQADLVVALGARFDDRVTGQASSFAPLARIVHADIDESEISKIVKADVALPGDCGTTITGLLGLLARDGGDRERLDPWWARLRALQRTYPLGYSAPEDGSLSPQYVVQTLGRLVGPEACYVAGVGQHQMWAAQFVSYEHPRTFINSGGLGTMGFAIPAAMGASLARPGRQVWVIDGDGCFQMTGRELATCARERIPIKVAVINNGGLGMVRQLQDLFYSRRFHGSHLDSTRVPDLVAYAEAHGCAGLRCDRAEDVEAVVRKAEAFSDAPVVIDFVVSEDALVWPMVAAGTSNDDIKVARDLAPIWDRAD
ncbi:thiamine pyrophosphate-dependent enzyme [Nonomuraea rubra]|uniref:thiamine pyrophosphate-dependent enzyme n=1 Tax=Nonomuraea rubra TaxID=46180 RepID=UPI0033ED88A1